MVSVSLNKRCFLYPIIKSRGFPLFEKNWRVNYRIKLCKVSNNIKQFTKICRQAVLSICFQFKFWLEFFLYFFSVLMPVICLSVSKNRKKEKEQKKKRTKMSIIFFSTEADLQLISFWTKVTVENPSFLHFYNKSKTKNSGKSRKWKPYKYSRTFN